MRIRWHLLYSLAASLVAPEARSVPSPVDALPYRSFEVQIDGRLDEWRPPYFETRFAEDRGDPAQRNRMRVLLVWDQDALLLGFTIEDAELIRAPTPLIVDQFHQYDSAQLYVDTAGDFGAKMNDDDVDILMLPDGRTGVLRGDELISALAPVSVPQRVGAPLPLEYAARIHAAAWTAELRVPFAGLGLHPRAGARIGLDVATTDWHVDHLPSPPSNYVLEGLRGRAAMSAEAAATAEAADDAVATHAVIAELADAVATTDLALNWSGGRDFGYPSNWRAFVLSGSPVWSERLLQRLGPQRLLLTMAAALALAIATVVALQWFLHRRSLRRLMQRLVELDRLQSTQSVDRGGDAETDLAPGDASATIPRDPRDVAFAQRVLAHVREHLELDLSPDALAEHFHVSLRTLQRRLREGLGSAPKDLVLAARLEAAHALLAQGELRVGEVAARVGFDNLSQFSRRFREAYGELPSAVRRQT